jgi:superfamily II DNA or RNA helicase
VSHRGVIRGFDISGCEPATMVVNYRYASAFELIQTLGRGNRTQEHDNDADLHVFADKDDAFQIRDLQNKATNIAIAQQPQSDMLHAKLHAVMSKFGATDTENQFISGGEAFKSFTAAAFKVAEVFGMANESFYCWAIYNLNLAQAAIEK